jgi:hypothetical protein
MQAAMEAAKANGVAEPVITEKQFPEKLERADVLTLENFFLKIQNLKLQADKLQADYQRCGQLMQEQQNELRGFRDSLSGKYGVDLAKCQIGPDGTITKGGPGQVPQAHQS